MTPEETAGEVARGLFTDGRGNEWSHLSMNNASELGWSEGPVRDRIQKAIEEAVSEAQAAERERCARIAEDVAEGHHMPIIREAAYAIRRSSPDPEFLAREHLDAWLTEHKTCCRQCVDAEERGVKSECVRRIDLKEKLKVLEALESTARQVIFGDRRTFDDLCEAPVAVPADKPKENPPTCPR